MIRRLFAILSAASLVLCVAACVLWVATRSGWELTSGRGAGRGWEAAARSYGLTVVRRTEHGTPPPLPLPPGWSVCDSMELETDVPGVTVMRFRSEVSRPVVGSLFGPPAPVAFDASTTQVSVSYWLAAAAAAILPAVRLARRLARMGRRRPPGTRAACGYDLRATPGRCPECGMVPTGSGDSSSARHV